MKELLQQGAMGLVDTLMAVLPRSVPSDSALRNCKIVSHRGEHDNSLVQENTLKAFELARSAGVWGIECDLRWTSDNVPVICHDADTARVFGSDRLVAQSSFEELREAVPDIPSLAEVIEATAPDCHLMLEIKCIDEARLTEQRAILKRHLAPLNAVEHYHILALDPALFQLVDFVPSAALLPVAELNVSQLSDVSLERGYSGLAGHFLMLGTSVQRRHESAGQVVGVGFPRSRNSLFRELGRGVEWVFSNDAVKLQGIVDDHLK